MAETCHGRDVSSHVMCFVVRIGGVLMCCVLWCVLQDAKAKGAQVISPGAAQNWGHSTVFPSIVFPVTKAMRVMQVPRPDRLHIFPYIYIHLCIQQHFWGVIVV